MGKEAALPLPPGRQKSSNCNPISPCQVVDPTQPAEAGQAAFSASSMASLGSPFGPNSNTDSCGTVPGPAVMSFSGGVGFDLALPEQPNFSITGGGYDLACSGC